MNVDMVLFSGFDALVVGVFARPSVSVRPEPSRGHPFSMCTPRLDRLHLKSTTTKIVDAIPQESHAERRALASAHFGSRPRTRVSNPSNSHFNAPQPQLALHPI